MWRSLAGPQLDGLRCWLAADVRSQIADMQVEASMGRCMALFPLPP